MCKLGSSDHAPAAVQMWLATLLWSALLLLPKTMLHAAGMMIIYRWQLLAVQGWHCRHR